MKLWVDDVRRPPGDDWTWVLHVEDALEILATGEVTELALDNDLHPFERDGTEIVDWMVENGVWPDTIHVHTANNFASTYMCRIIERNGFEGIPGRPRSFERRT